MPKLPRNVSHDRMVRFLQKRGWSIRPGKRHTVAFKDDVQVAVPRHTSLKIGTVRAILRVAGISLDDAVRDL